MSHDKQRQQRTPSPRGLRWMAWFLVVGALTAAGGLTAAEPAAAPSEPQVFKDWRVQCETPEGAEKHCHMFQNVVLKEDGRQLLHIAVGHVPDQERQIVAILTLPLGIALPPGVSLQVDDAEPMRLPVEHCIPQGCRVLLPVDDNLLGAMKAGTLAKVTFNDATRQPIGVPVSLSGFTAAFNALKPPGD